MSYVKYLFETFKSVTLCFKEGSGSVLMGALTISKQLTSRPRKPVTMGEEMTFEKMCDTMGIPPNFRGGKKLIKRFYSKRKYVHKHWLLLPSGYLYQTPLRLFLWSCCDCKHFSPLFSMWCVLIFLVSGSRTRTESSSMLYKWQMIAYNGFPHYKTQGTTVGWQCLCSFFSWAQQHQLVFP